MIVRGLDPITGDWLFGKGTADYKTGQDAIEQCIQTRVLMFLNNCFFASNAGIDWFSYLGGRGAVNQLQVELAVSAAIANTYGVKSLVQVSAVLTGRNLQLTYTVQTIFSAQVGELVNTGAYILTEDGAFLTTEDGSRLIQG